MGFIIELRISHCGRFKFLSFSLPQSLLQLQSPPWVHAHRTMLKVQQGDEKIIR
ncbi:uncharacterized protein DS421_17g592410 [Arachis hypogaea]|nr:uncharacterized protein DS421_17g592410 [Arachis hypogaea]